MDVVGKELADGDRAFWPTMMESFLTPDHSQPARFLHHKLLHRGSCRDRKVAIDRQKNGHTKSTSVDWQ